MNPRNIGVVFRKELLDTLRDRRTIISSILLPLLIVPVLIIGLGGLAILLAKRATRENMRVMILGAEHAPDLAARLRQPVPTSETPDPSALVATPRLDIVAPATDYVQQINDTKLRAAVEFPPRLEERLRTNPEETQIIKIYWYDGEFRSRTAVRRIERIVNAYRDELVEARLAGRRISADAVKPFVYERQNVAPPEKVSGNNLGLLLPYLVIAFTLGGAMYPAMDLTAGEKERGTIETILASAASRAELVLGKFLVVMLVSLVTTALSITSLALTFLLGGTLLGRITTKLVLTVSGKSAITVFFIVLPLAVLFAALLLAISLWARNYREAQSYLGPLMIVVILPAAASTLPGVELTARMALIPILNVSLVSKEVLAGNYPWAQIALIFGSTSVYAAAALAFAVRQFHREEVLFRT